MLSGPLVGEQLGHSSGRRGVLRGRIPLRLPNAHHVAGAVRAWWALLNVQHAVTTWRDERVCWQILPVAADPVDEWEQHNLLPTLPAISIAEVRTARSL